MDDAAGTPWMGQAAEQLRERTKTLDILKGEVEQIDMTDPNAFAALVTNKKVMYMGSLEDFPEITHNAMVFVMGLINKADKLDPEISSQCRGAFTAAILEQLEREKEVTEDEDDNSNVSH